MFTLMLLSAPYFVLLYLSVAFFTGDIAYQKGRVSALWFILGLLFGPVAMLAAIGIPDRPKVREAREAAKAAQYATIKSEIAGIFQKTPRDAAFYNDQY